MQVSLSFSVTISSRRRNSIHQFAAAVRNLICRSISPARHKAITQSRIQSPLSPIGLPSFLWISFQCKSTKCTVSKREIYQECKTNSAHENLMSFWREHPASSLEQNRGHKGGENKFSRKVSDLHLRKTFEEICVASFTSWMECCACSMELWI